MILSGLETSDGFKFDGGSNIFWSEILFLGICGKLPGSGKFTESRFGKVNGRVKSRTSGFEVAVCRLALAGLDVTLFEIGSSDSSASVKLESGSNDFDLAILF